LFRWIDNIPLDR